MQVFRLNDLFAFHKQCVAYVLPANSAGRVAIVCWIWSDREIEAWKKQHRLPRQTHELPLHTNLVFINFYRARDEINVQPRLWAVDAFPAFAVRAIDPSLYCITPKLHTAAQMENSSWWIVPSHQLDTPYLRQAVFEGVNRRVEIPLRDNELLLHGYAIRPCEVAQFLTELLLNSSETMVMGAAMGGRGETVVKDATVFSVREMPQMVTIRFASSDPWFLTAQY